MPKLLPHELMLINRALERGYLENLRASEDMSRAASDTNSWHDNSEYDEVIERMKNIDSRYTPLLKLLNICEVVDYPEDNKNVSIGSVVRTIFNDEIVHILIVGQIYEGKDTYEELWQRENITDLTVLSVDSPLGAILLGSKVDDTKELVINNNINNITIINIDNDWIKKIEVKK